MGWEDPLKVVMATHFSIHARESNGQKSLTGYNSLGHTESDTTEETSHDCTHIFIYEAYFINSVQLLSHIQLFVTTRTAACQPSLSITNSWNLLKLMSSDAIQPSRPLSSPSLPAFNLSQHQGLFPVSQFFASGG